MTLKDVMEQLTSLNVQLARLEVHNGNLSDRLAEFCERQAERNGHQDSILENLEQRIRSLEEWRAKAIGYAAGAAFVGGLIGGFLPLILRVWS